MLAKPQFELQPADIGKGGVVRDAALRREAVRAVAECARSLGAVVRGSAPAGLPGPAGNRETFLWLAATGEEAAVDAW